MSTILVIDDKEMMRDSVAATLARKGHNVVAASTGQAALQRLGQRSFDAIITDLQMPEMDGLELLQEIRQIDEQLPVIFMTAFGTVQTAVAAMKPPSARWMCVISAITPGFRAFRSAGVTPFSVGTPISNPSPIRLTKRNTIA